MAPPQSSLPNAWTAAVLDANDAPVGLGVLVKPNHLVTCAHVVADALGISHIAAPPADISVAVRSVRTLKRTLGRVVLWHPVDAKFTERLQDICLLELDDEQMALASWEDLRAQDPRIGNTVRVFGYPSLPGKLSTGSVLAGEVAGGWWQLDLPHNPLSTFTPIGRGFSGSLAWDRDEEKAVGIVVAKSGDNAATYLIPSELLYEACGHIGESVTEAPPSAATNERADGGSTGPHDVFLCHASSDKPTVRELANALRARGLRVWFDEWELVPGRPWQEALESAVRSVGSAAVLVGPSGIGPWADREMRAFLSQFVARGVSVIPVLLHGAAAKPELPLFLEAFTWVDLRAGLTDAGLERLIWGITGKRPAAARAIEVGEGAPGALLPAAASPSAQRLFRMWNVPPLPPAYQPRPELEALKAALLSPDQRPLALTGERTRFAVQGMGGVGKSVLAAALARDPEVRRAFPDGVFWLTLGQTPGDATLTQAQLAAGLRASTEAVTFKSVGEGTAALRDLLANRAVLLVLDDVWNTAHAEPFNVLGERGKLLLTTRSAEITRSLGTEPHAIGTLSAANALDLLAQYAGLDVSRLPPEAPAIARECGELPLALAMLGAQLRDKPADRWRTALARLHAADLDRLRAQLPGYPHASLLAAMQISVDDLEPPLRDRYLELAVFPEDTAIPEATLATYWAPEGLNEGDVQTAVDTFIARSLAHRDTEGRLVLHDLQRDFLRARTRDRGSKLDEQLVAAYRRAAPKGLHLGPNDGYFFEHISVHLAVAEGPSAVRALLLDQRWLRARLAATSTTSLLTDFDRAGDLVSDEALRLLRDALRLSAHVLNQRPAELGGQLLGRLRAFAGRHPELGDLCTTLVKAEQRPYLIPQWASLIAPGGPLIRTLEGHQGSVTAVAFSADGRTALSGSDDNTLKLWNLASGELLRTLEGHQDSVRGVALSADGKTALSGSDDDTLKLWNLASGELLRTLEGHQDSVTAVALSADGKTALSGSDDNTLKLWNLASGELLLTLQGHQDWVTAVALSADGKTALSGSHDSTLKLWNLHSGELILTLQGHQDWVSPVALSADGKTALSGSDDNTLKLWNLASGELIFTLQGHQDSVTAVALSADGKTALSGSDDNTLKLWNLASGELILTLQGHQSSVYAVALSADAKTALSGSLDRTLKLWNLASGELLLSAKGHQDSVTAVALSADAKTALSCSDDDTLKLWNLASGELLRTLQGHRGWATAVALNVDGKTVLSGSHDNTLKLWNLASGELLRTLQGHQGWITAVALSADGKMALSGSQDNTLKHWNLASGEVLRTLESHQIWVQAVALSADGKTALSGSLDRSLKLWNLSTGELLRTLEGHQQRIRAVALCADGRTAFSGSDDHTLKLWNLASGSALSSFTADASILTVASTADGRAAVAGDALGRIHLFEIDLGADYRS